jgi:hypothetical protein
MRRSLSLFYATLVAGAGVALGGLSPVMAAEAVAPAIASRAQCSALASTDLTDLAGAGSKITSALAHTNAGIELCAVQGVLAPSIEFKVELPVKTWTERFLQVGCGGTCGHVSLSIGAADGCAPITKGEFVVSGSDMGHQGMSTEFGRNPQQLVDFAYRGVHLTALATKKLIQAYYGQAARYAYFNGCSDGGREALMEAQRFPQDFQGVIAGAPAMLFQVQNSLHHGWLAMSNTDSDGKAILTDNRLPVLHKAVLDACDALDGQKDGLLADPRLCHFDPKTIQCKADQSDTSACLSAAEVTAATRIYQGPKDSATGDYLTVGSAQYGSELEWAGVFVPNTQADPIFSSFIAQGALQNLIFAQPPAAGYKVSDLAFNKATLDQVKQRHTLMDATNPDLSAFAKAGGKLMLWHGWSDPHISPMNTIAYHQAVQDTMGKDSAQQFERLYLLPGVSHCGRGEGPSALDLLTAMMGWVESGKAPAAIQTSTAQGEPSEFGQPASVGSSQDHPPGPPPASAAALPRSRPVYPFPAVARYTGQGDANVAANYVEGSALVNEAVRNWAGEDMFKPYPFSTGP